MTRQRWYTVREADVLWVARRWPVRIDVAADAAFPIARPGRLAHQIRQDLWRAFRGVRGFSPVIRVEKHSGGLAVRAGGRCDGPVDRARAEARIETLLQDPAHRARWLRHARLCAPAREEA